MKETKRSFAVVLLVLLWAVSASAQVDVKTVKPDGMPNRAAWMAQGSYGVMVHYLMKPQGKTAEEKTADLNRTVDNFDLDHFMGQFDQTGADWLIFTLAQGTGFLSSKNEFIDDLQQGISPNRDLIPEIAAALHQRDRKLIVYLPGAHTGADPVMKKLLGLGTEGYAERHNDLIRHYSLKLGKQLNGWWFDSCRPQADTAWQEEMDACRAGNPDSVVAFSGAEFCAAGTLKPRCPIEDYHAGEIHLLEDGKIRTDFVYPPGQGNILVSAEGKLRKRGQEAKFYMPDSQFIDNVQWHCLLPIDLTFNPAVPNQYCHYTDKELFQFVDDVKSVAGAITINVPIDRTNGHIPRDTHAQLVRLGEHLEGSTEARSSNGEP